jgi:hypothetical protein
MKVIKFLEGKKTFIIAALMVVLGLLQGNNDMILQGLGLVGLRLAIK